jgi:hypothetical protein
LQVATAVAERTIAAEQSVTEAEFPAVEVRVTVPVGTPDEVLVTVTENSTC